MKYLFHKIIPCDSIMVEENFENSNIEILKNAIKSHQVSMFDCIIPCNSIMVGEKIENIVLQIPENATKSHDTFMFGNKRDNFQFFQFFL